MVACITRLAWEKQPLSKAIKIERSNPHTVKQIFASHASRFHMTAVQLACRCPDTPPLPRNRHIIHGHVAYTPLLVPCEGTCPRPNDPLPLKGSKVRAQLIKDLTKCAN